MRSCVQRQHAERALSVLYLICFAFVITIAAQSLQNCSAYTCHQTWWRIESRVKWLFEKLFCPMHLTISRTISIFGTRTEIRLNKISWKDNYMSTVSSRQNQYSRDRSIKSRKFHSWHQCKFDAKCFTIIWCESKMTTINAGGLHYYMRASVIEPLVPK